jgi:ribosomal protein S18 acetylase RimI-like enzyme
VTASSSAATGSVAIVPLAEPHFDGLRRALDTVAREQRFLAFTEAPPPQDCLAFYIGIVTNGLCLFVAVEGTEVLGWCDVLPCHGQARAHVGTLGIGLLPAARQRGIGRRLMEAAIARAWALGFTRIELTVRVDNQNAKRLYKRMGFQIEGTQVRAFCVDGVYVDMLAMALLR